jgi:diamine N-acetyltransferase
MIYGDGIRLRAIERTDIPKFLKWFNDPEVTKGLATIFPMSEAREIQWFDEMLKRPIEVQPFGIEIEVDGEWQLIGNTSFFDFDKFAHSSEIGIVIGEKKNWGKGYGSKALRLVLKHGFDSMNLNRISLKVYALNDRAIRVYNKVGFTLEGTMRDAIFRDGKYFDVHMMSILRKEWKPID